MTVIAGFVDKKTNKVYVGADKGFFDDDNHCISPEPKIMKKTIGKYEGKPIQMIIGNSGDIKPGNIITHWYTPKLKYDPTKQTPHEFMIKVFAPALKEQFEKNGYKKPEDCECFVAFEGSIFIVNADYSIMIPPEFGTGVGSASLPAIASLFTMNRLKSKISPRKKITLAIETAIGISNTAKGPIDILVV